jgi:hypothetical protein
MNARILAILTLTSAFAAGCPGAWKELNTKTGLSSSSQSAALFASMAVNDPQLCETGSATLQFQRKGDAFAFGLSASAGDVIRVEGAGDPTLDTVVYLFGPLLQSFGELVSVASDDDSGGSLHGLISDFPIVTGGRYVVVITTYQGDGLGNAILRVAVNGNPGCAFASLSLAGDADVEPVDALCSEEGCPDVDSEVACASCCILHEIATSTLLAADDAYSSLQVMPQDAQGLLVRSPTPAPLSGREYLFQLQEDQDTVPIYLGNRLAMADILDEFRGCQVRINGKMVDAGYGIELWPGTVSFEP